MIKRILICVTVNAYRKIWGTKNPIFFIFLKPFPVSNSIRIFYCLFYYVKIFCTLPNRHKGITYSNNKGTYPQEKCFPRESVLRSHIPFLYILNIRASLTDPTHCNSKINYRHFYTLKKNLPRHFCTSITWCQHHSCATPISLAS